MMKRLLPFILIAGSLLARAEIQFNREILPILSDKCFFCHGPDKANQKSDLRLDLREEAIASKAIIPGNPKASQAIKRITTTNIDEIMPPLDSHLSLTDEEKKKLTQWIKEGAEYQPHWAFISVDPATNQSTIDQIVSDRLQAMDRSLQVEAKKTTLLRRVYFDLIGLPPNPEEIEAYLEDDSANAYTDVVDNLLNRRAYGERMAVHWLDLARYADSNGYQTDKDRTVWAWKDWVIEAFNKNLPYDDFVTYQLAGDLLPDPTREQRLATAFNRLHQYKNEGGSVEEEFRVESVADRVNTFGTAFLGLTLECARCHDHKYDPISQKEYFQLFAFFDDIDESGLASYFGRSIPTPTLPLANEKTSTELAKLTENKAELEKAFVQAQDNVTEETLRTWYANDPDLLKKAPAGIAMNLESNDEGRGHLFDGDNVQKTSVGKVTRHDPFSLSFWMWAPKHKERAIICHLSDHWTDAGSRGWELVSLQGRLRFSMIHFWPGNAISIETRAPIPVEQWMHISMTYDGSSTASGMALYIDGVLIETEVFRDHLTKFITPADFPKTKRNIDGIRWGARARDHGFTGGRIDDAVYYDSALNPIEIREIFQPTARSGLMGKPYVELGPSEKAFIKAAYLRDTVGPIQEIRSTLKAARKAHGDAMDAVPEILTMKDLPQPKKAYILNRGVYDARGEEVFADTPEALIPMVPGQPKNRLGLANWLTDPQHPLFARVAVNRFWMLCFGRGVVDTAEDFGLQGKQPQYPELIDHLAADFVQSGWDIKALMRKIVTSETYRQQSIASEELMRDDPYNRLIARGPSHRLSAEMIRDNALAASGLLVEAKNSAPKSPYDLSEAFKQLSVPQGDGLYHRSIYSRWKRSAPPPVMIAFDGVKRDVCSAKRQTTNTPLQSLVLLNGPQFVEAARVAGIQAWNDSEGQLPQLIRELSLRFISREPASKEVEILTELYHEQLNYFAQNSQAAEELLSVGHKKLEGPSRPAEFAAATVLAQTLMNFDESVVKR